MLHSTYKTGGTFRIALLAAVVSLASCTSLETQKAQEATLAALSSDIQAQKTEIATLQTQLSTLGTALQKQGEADAQQLAQLNQNLLEAYAKSVNMAREEAAKAAPAPAKTESIKQSAPAKLVDRVNGKIIVGEVEHVYLFGPGFVYDARIDSGAETSSLDARNVERFERDGVTWVRFDVPVPGEEGVYKTLERKLVRNVRILQSAADDTERRAVVELEFAVGDHKQKAEFNLSARDSLSYPILVGRNILRDVMVVDVGKEYATQLPKSLLNNDKE